MTQSIQHLHVHGPGRAATGLARMARAVGVATTGLSGGGRAGAAATRAALERDVPWTAGPPDLATLPAGTLVIVGVPDDAIVAAARDLAGALSSDAPSSVTVAHLAASREVDDLAPLAARGVTTAGFHPLRSFPAKDVPAADLGGALVGIEASSPTALGALRDLAARLGGRPFELAPGMRSLYHMGASVAGNAVLGLLDVARAAFAHAGVPDALATDGLATLMGGAIRNAAATDIAAALTGPVVRGDVETLTAHMKAIDATLPEVRPLYLELVRHQLGLCARRDDAARSQCVRRWLQGETS